MLAAAAFGAAGMPSLQRFYYGMLLGSTALMVVVHAWGALRRIQPATETWEIAYWTTLFVLALLFRPLA